VNLVLELDALDRERPDQPFTARVAGQVVAFRAAQDLTWRDLIDGLRNFIGFVTWIAPGDEASTSLLSSIPVWKMQGLMTRYRQHYGLPENARGDQRLLNLLGHAEYRKAIEWDLHAIHGLDVTTEWQARRWRRLLDFIDGLPNHSHFGEAMAADEELAAAIIDADDGKPKKPVRRISDYSPEVEMLTLIADRVAENTQVLVASRGGKPRKLPHLPRPVTAVEKVRAKRRQKKHEWTVARVYGRIGPGSPPPNP
jgi:hypothetical protein